MRMKGICLELSTELLNEASKCMSLATGNGTLVMVWSG